MHSSRGHINSLTIILFISFFFFPGAAQPATDWSPLVNKLVADGFEESAVRGVFQRPEVAFDPMVMTRKVESLIKVKYFKPPPSTAKKITRTYKGFQRPEVINGAFAYMQDNSKLLGEAQARYGVPREIIVSILLVETKLGEYVGSKNAFNSLASMALCSDLEKIKPVIKPDLLTEKTEAFAQGKCRLKSEWAYAELKALIRYCRDTGTDLMAIPGSFYGAIGICQFMPSQVYRHGVDADGDGKVDVFGQADAFHSVANYLKNHGWKPGKMTRRQQVRAIYAYNHSSVYANTVLAVAQGLNQKRRQAVKGA